MDSVETMLAGIARDPADRTAWLALGDALEEGGEPERAEMLRIGLLLREDPEGASAATMELRLRELLSQGVKPCLPGCTLEGIQLVLLPPGSFFMGMSEGPPQGLPSSRPRHKVTLTRGFWMSIHPVTQQQWQSMIAKLPSRCRFKGEDFPMHGLAWPGCQRFCTLLGRKTGRTIRLPTEAEWEYACRAGTTSDYCFGDNPAQLIDYAWFASNADGPHPVGQKKANAWGLYDMHGNITEWCQDWFQDGYDSTEPRIDPTGPEQGSMRLLRGGAWYSNAELCRSAHRARNTPTESYHGYGFRVVVELE